jgi:hypothetical protein
MPEDAIERIVEVKGIIADSSQVPAEYLDGANGKVRENRRNTLLNRLDAVIHGVEDATDPEDYRDPINQLTSILDKTDGCEERGTPDTIGSVHTPDWIINCRAQEYLTPRLQSALSILEMLREGDTSP